VKVGFVTSEGTSEMKEKARADRGAVDRPEEGPRDRHRSASNLSTKRSEYRCLIFANNAGAALSMIPPGVAAEGVQAGSIEDALLSSPTDRLDLAVKIPGYGRGSVAFLV